MKAKVSCILWLSGLGLCLMCALYMVYVSAANKAAAKLKTTGGKALIIAGMAAVTEGEVVRADDTYTIIRYYHEWDGTDYKNVIPHAVSGYQEGAKVPVAYTVGMGAGTCLLVGLYKKTVLLAGIVGAVLIVLGTVTNLKKKGIKKCQEEKL